MERILVSACLLGRPVRYDGGAKPSDDEVLARWRKEGRLLSICPEVVGGLPVPRSPAEIRVIHAGSGSVPANGSAVLDGVARVVTADGTDVTAAFLRGAQQTLEIAEHHGVRMAVLKEGSPSCGGARIHDGTFTGTSIVGFGVTTALLRRHGIRVFSEHQLQEAAACLGELEPSR